MFEAIIVGLVVVGFVYYIMKKDSSNSGTKPTRPPEQDEGVQ